MTALRVPARPEQDASPRPVPWRRMAWVTWRQHRFALAGVAVLLGGLAVWLWLEGLAAHRAYAAAADCHPASSGACGTLVGYFLNYVSTGQVIATVLQAAPALIGAFVGAPVLAREMETGTFRYAWTQGFGRWRWTLAKLVPLGIAVAVAAGAFSLLFSWYYQPFITQTLSFNAQVPLDAGVFDLRGVAFAAWTLAAFAIGALAGMLIRRVATAIAATLAVYTGLAVAAGLYLREHYMAPLLVKNASAPRSAWVISQQWYAKGGQPVSQNALSQVLQQGAPQLAGGKGGIPQDDPTVNQYLAQHGYTLWTTYQPGSRFWPFQWIEGGWLLALSVLLIAATVWLVRRRAA
jgi:hypothetical protein